MIILYLVFRIILGVLIAGAGFGKLLDISGFVSVIRTYRLHLPTLLIWIAAIGVTVFELALGVWVLSGYHIKAAALWSVAMHGGYFILLTSSLLRGLRLENCGCFGVFLARPLTWYSPLEDIVLIAASYGLFVFAK